MIIPFFFCCHVWIKMKKMFSYSINLYCSFFFKDIATVFEKKVLVGDFNQQDFR